MIVVMLMSMLSMLIRIRRLMITMMISQVKMKETMYKTLMDMLMV